MTRRFVAMTVASVTLLGGCATGYNRGLMDETLRAARPAYTSTDLSVEEIERMKPQISLPARIAIAPPTQRAPMRWGRTALDTWSPDEVAVFESWREPLQQAGIAKDLVVLPKALVRDCDSQDSACQLKAQRAAAARMHADALLVINVATATDDYLNPASLLYVTLIGMWIVPGSHNDALSIAEGVLLDNRNEYLYAFARGEGERKSVRPTGYADPDAVVSASRVEALTKFGEAFIAEARQLRVR